MPNDRPPANSLHILVVDDDSDIRESLCDALAQEPEFKVDGVDDGLQALERMTLQPPDLVLLDLMMPKMSGWQVLAEINRRPDLKSVSVFVVTAAGNVGTIPPGTPVFVKPVAVDRLVESIRRLFAARTRPSG
jgi:CheY-like chemotaxis protein